MATILASKSLLNSPLGQDFYNSNLAEGLDFAFLPIPYLIYIVESVKKRGTTTIDLLKIATNSAIERFSVIELSPQALCRFLDDESLSEIYISKRSNPFEFATKASLYDDCFWGDIGELNEDIDSIVW